MTRNVEVEAEITRVVGVRIRAARRSEGLTQMELAAKVNIASSRLGDYERGVNLPRFTTMVRICRALAIDLEPLADEIMGLTETNKKGPTA